MNIVLESILYVVTELIYCIFRKYFCQNINKFIDFTLKLIYCIIFAFFYL